jgi:ankyrin repeat protein
MDIFKAISSGNLPRVKELIQEPGFDINQIGEYKYTPVNYAILYKKFDIIDELLKVPGININIPAPDGMTVLFNAVNLNNLELVKKILQVPGVDVNYIYREDDETALIIASKGKVHEIRTEIVRELLQVPGINVNHANDRGNTALILACLTGNEPIIHLLLQVPGINVNHRNYRRESALSVACKEGDLAIAYLLMQIPGIDINAGKPLFHLINRGILGWSDISEIETIIHAILELPGVDINHVRKTEFGDETLLSITFNRDNRLVNIRNDLIAHGADLNTALIIGITNQNLEMVQELVERGADVTTTELDKAKARRSNLDILRALERAIDRLRTSVINVYVEKTGIGGSAVQILLEYLGIPAAANVMLGGYYKKLEKYQYKLKI